MKEFKILIVEDDPVTRLLLEKRLEALEYDVDCAQNGAEACTLIANQHYDLVLTDLKMPGDVDGIGVLEAAKRKNHRTEVILITAHASVDNAVEAMKKGAGDYLQKPINFDELMMRIEKINNMKKLAKNADDLREAMDITEKNAGETIQHLELTIAKMQLKLTKTKNLLSQPSVDATERIQLALGVLTTA